MGREVTYASELTEDIKVNASFLLAKVNRLLEELEVDVAEVSSGWRPSAINTQAGGAKRSNHLTGHAVDIRDRDRSLVGKILLRQDLLETCELWMEDPDFTPTWIHLQDVSTKSGRRIFTP